MITPDFVVVGHPKCGSTSLQQYLHRHPQLYMGSQKEPSLYMDQWEAWKSGDLAYFPEDLPKGTVKGDATVGYVKMPEVASRIADCKPDTRIVFLLRDPIERALSHYHHWLRHGKDTRSLSRVIAESSYEHYFYRFGTYHTHLQQYRSHFPDAQICILFFEDLVADPVTTLGLLWTFLGVPPLEVTTFPEQVWENAGHGVSSRRLSRFLKVQKESDGVKKALPRPLRKLGGGLIRRLERWNRSSRRHQPTRAEYEVLRTFFAPQVQGVKQWLQQQNPEQILPAWLGRYE